ETNGCRGLAQIFNPRHSISLVLDAYAPPHVRQIGGKTETSSKEAAQPLRALRQNLKRVPGRQLHDTSNVMNKLFWHVLVEKITHAVDEDHAGISPAQRLPQFFGN